MALKGSSKRTVLGLRGHFSGENKVLLDGFALEQQPCCDHI